MKGRSGLPWMERDRRLGGRRRALIQRRTARRLEPPGNFRCEIRVRPDGNGTVTIVLPITADCEADGAICKGG